MLGVRCTTVWVQSDGSGLRYEKIERVVSGANHARPTANAQSFAETRLGHLK